MCLFEISATVLCSGASADAARCEMESNMEKLDYCSVWRCDVTVPCDVFQLVHVFKTFNLTFFFMLMFELDSVNAIDCEMSPCK